MESPVQCADRSYLRCHCDERLVRENSWVCGPQGGGGFEELRGFLGITMECYREEVDWGGVLGTGLSR